MEWFAPLRPHEYLSAKLLKTAVMIGTLAAASAPGVKVAISAIHSMRIVRSGNVNELSVYKILCRGPS